MAGKTPILMVHRLDPTVPMPDYSHPGDAGLDVSAGEDVELASMERAAVRTGLVMAVPEGWVGLIHPRSGLALRQGLTLANAPGTVDAGYRGELKILVVNLGSEPVKIAKGDRIAQLLLQEVGHATVVEVSNTKALGQTRRGESGFGSTGTAS